MRKLYSFVFYFLPAFAFAQGTEDCTGIICNPIGWAKTSSGETVETIPQFLDLLLQIMITVAIPLVSILIIYTGYLFATAKGDMKKIEKYRDMLLYIVIGLAILLMSKGIQMALQSTIDSLK